MIKVMKVYQFDNYKDFVVKRVKAMPKGGYGQFLKIAQSLSIHSTMVSQILKGSSHFTLEHSLKLCEYFGFSDGETEFFLALVQRDRAGTKRLRDHFTRQILSLREKALSLGEIHKLDKQLDEKNQAL